MSSRSQQPSVPGMDTWGSGPSFNDGVITLAYPFQFPLKCPLFDLGACGATSRGGGLYSAYPNYLRHVREKHEGCKVAVICRDCDFTADGKYLLKLVKAHHDRAHPDGGGDTAATGCAVATRPRLTNLGRERRSPATNRVAAEGVIAAPVDPATCGAQPTCTTTTTRSTTSRTTAATPRSTTTTTSRRGAASTPNTSASQRTQASIQAFLERSRRSGGNVPPAVGSPGGGHGSLGRGSTGATNVPSSRQLTTTTTSRGGPLIRPSILASNIASPRATSEPPIPGPLHCPTTYAEATARGAAPARTTAGAPPSPPATRQRIRAASLQPRSPTPPRRLTATKRAASAAWVHSPMGAPTKKGRPAPLKAAKRNRATTSGTAAVGPTVHRVGPDLADGAVPGTSNTSTPWISQPNAEAEEDIATPPGAAVNRGTTTITTSVPPAVSSAPATMTTTTTTTSVCGRPISSVAPSNRTNGAAIVPMEIDSPPAHRTRSRRATTEPPRAAPSPLTSIDRVKVTRSTQSRGATTTKAPPSAADAGSKGRRTRAMSEPPGSVKKGPQTTRGANDVEPSPDFRGGRRRRPPPIIIEESSSSEEDNATNINGSSSSRDPQQQQ